MDKKICVSFKENDDIKAGDKILVQLPNEEDAKEFIVKKLDKNFKNLPIIEYNGVELVIDRRIIKKLD